MNGEEYKVGDKLKCIPDFTTTEDSGGSGYVVERVITVKSISNKGEKPDNKIYWPEITEDYPRDRGIYGRALTRANHPVSVINNYPIF